MKDPFYDEETIIQLLMARYTLTERNSSTQWRDLKRIAIDIDNVSRAIKTRKLLNTYSTMPYSKPINSALRMSKYITEQVMKDVDEGRASKYAHLAKSMGNEDNHWGVEVFIGKAQDIMGKLKGHCVGLKHATPQNAKDICRALQWHLYWFPLMGRSYEPREPTWFQR